MGIHEFFISIYPLGVERTIIGKEQFGDLVLDVASFTGKSAIKPDDIRACLRQLYGKEDHTLKHDTPDVSYAFYNPHDTYRYEKGGRILLQLTVDNDQLNCWKLSLVGCYAWYPEGIEEMYEIFTTLNREFLRLYPYISGVGELPKSKDSFIEQTRQRYDEAWIYFQTMYPLHEPISPTEFYKYVNNFHYRLYHRLLKRRRSWIR